MAISAIIAINAFTSGDIPPDMHMGAYMVHVPLHLFQLILHGGPLGVLSGLWGSVKQFEF